MAKKVVRRRVIMREYDYRKITKDGTGVLYNHMVLYTSSSFEPMTKTSIEQDAMWGVLKNQSGPKFKVSKYPLDIFDDVTAWLYSSNYKTWHKWWDDQGYLLIQARKNTPVSRVGWATFEYRP